MKPKFTSLSQIKAAIRAGQTNCSLLVEQYLSRIAASQELNIYVEVFAEEALNRARQLDEKYQKDPSSVGKLFGMVVSIKDVICYEGHQVTAGSKILAGFTSLFSATVVERLLAEDAIIIGRVNCDEFAMGSTTENSCYGPTRNAADPSRVPGGSSGGSAVSVQADTCLVSLGSDTGGSVRQPASFCGVVGFKPTYGRISRYGLLAYASSFDQIGILAHSVEDVATTLEVIAGPDEFDATCAQSRGDTFSKGVTSKGVTSGKSAKKQVRIACFDTALRHPSLDAGVKKLTFDFIEKLKAAGHEVEPVEFEYLDYIIPAYYVLTTAEASSNLSRYDGIRFGHRTAEADDIHEVYKKSRTEGFGTEVKRRIMLGTFVLSAGYYDAYYAKAQQVRRLIHDRTREIFKDYDFILMPASPIPAWEIGKMADDPVAMYLADIFTVQANMCGLPAISIPIGKHASGLPIGVQFMAAKFDEAALLAFSGGLSPLPH
ncbi:MAG: Asp-tRNA(Asn)/Glu-tRNA(Gln) amidotransferase subunit GatA [Saprospiraceae bacterium]|nr:MAG: Asp-tRNA(Asn)/Glu-tRNA(Gln) amidotransferase subunit GatA [Saprospiraceae bacterium]